MPLACVVPLLMVMSISDPVAQDARAAFGFFVLQPQEVERLEGSLRQEAARLEKSLHAVGPTQGLEDAWARHVITNLLDKIRLHQAGLPLPMTADEIERSVIQFEAFKLQAFVTSGVFPKRYFGYLDDKYDTAIHERTLRRVVHASVACINAYVRKRGESQSLTDQDVAVTFLAEGGAIFLRERQDLLKGLHPVQDVGLDDVASGFADLPGLMEALDKEVGTGLGSMVAWVEKDATRLPEPTTVPEHLRWLQHGHGPKGPFPYLKRLMTLEEALVGTALMYVWEQRIADRKLRAAGLPPLHKRPRDQAFIISSLVYNSGLLHVPERWEMIRTFSTDSWLSKTSRDNEQRRWALPVDTAARNLERMRTGGAYPEQPTSWLAVYHVLQRYGAWVALGRFSRVFTENGMFQSVPPGP